MLDFILTVHREHGSLSNDTKFNNIKRFVAKNSPISATVHKQLDNKNNWDLRVFVMPRERDGSKMVIRKGSPQPVISVFQFMYDENSDNLKEWGDVNISKNIQTYTIEKEEE
jgi:hypothetical protein